MAMNGNPTIDTRCSVCGMPLAEGTLLIIDGQFYCETDSPDVTKREVCDFCGELEPSWFYRVNPTELVELNLESYGSYGALLNDAYNDYKWLSCDGCAVLVDGGNFNALMVRIFTIRGRPNIPDEEVEDFVVVITHYIDHVLPLLLQPREERRG